MQPNPKPNEDLLMRNAESEPIFRAWKCEVIDRRMRPSGRKQKEGCLHWGINRSINPEPLATCKNCGRKSRLNPRTRRIQVFTSKEAAQAFVDIMNKYPDAGPQPDAPAPPPLEQKAPICHVEYPCGLCDQCTIPQQSPQEMLEESHLCYLWEIGAEVDF